MKLKFILKILLLFMCFMIFVNTNSIAQCSSSPIECQPTTNGHGPDPCDAKVYCSNSGVVEQGLIACTTAADTDGCGVEADAPVNPFNNSTLFSNQSVPASCYIDPSTNNPYTYIQWIKFATPPEVNTVKIQGVGQMNAWVVFYAGSEANTPPYQLNGCNNLTYVDGACSELNQYKVWTNTNAIIDPNTVNIYYIALLYDAPSNGSINFKVKECDLINGCVPEVNCPNQDLTICQGEEDPGAGIQDWLDEFSFSSCGNTLAWVLSGNGINADFDGLPATISALAAGTYTLTNSLVDQNNNIIASCSADIIVNALTTDYSDTQTVCTEIGTYTWSIDTDGDGINEDYTISSETTTTFNVTDVNGCDYDLILTLDFYPVPSCSIEVSPSNDCGGNDVTLTVSGADGTAPYTFIWDTDNDDDYDDDDTAGSDLINVGEGTYNVQVTDANGCTSECYYTVSEDCETSWAKASNSLCFNELGSQGCPNANQLPWGFTTPVEIGTTYTFDIIEGAPGICADNGSLGDTVGIAILNWDITTPVINFLTTDGEHYFSEIHVWVGKNPLPKKGKKCKSAPGQLGCTFENINETSFQINGLSDNICNGNTSGQQIWIAIHAVTCDLICENESYAGGSEVHFSKDDETDLEASKSSDYINSFDFQIFPNPVEDGQLEILINTVEANNVSIRIFNIHGKLMHQNKQQVFKGKNKYSLDVDELDSGIYLVHIQNGNNLISKRFIKVNR